MKISAFKTLTYVLALILIVSPATAHSTPPRFKAVAFDYFVIFNPNSIIDDIENVFPGKGEAFAKAWRAKQFEYGFLRSITNQHEDFFKVTEDALSYTLESMNLQATNAQKKTLLNAYLSLDPWPDAIEGLKKLKLSGIKIITIANFSERMLQENAKRAGIIHLFDELLSTEVNKSYKPSEKAYALGLQHLGYGKEDVVFAAFGGWDAYGAKSFGYPTYWVNRFNMPFEKFDIRPDATSNNFQGLLDFIFETP